MSKVRTVSLLLLPTALLCAVVAPGRAAEQTAMMSPSATHDGRKPLPLLAIMADHQKQNMREHLAAMEGIVAALARDDMEGVVQAARPLGLTEAMAEMCQHMGAAAPDFTAMALKFHRTADTIVDAARHRDRAGVLKALDRTLQTCVGCHATYRQEVVDEATWQRLTKQPHPPVSPHGEH